MFKKLAVLVVFLSLGAAGVQGASLMFPARNDADAGFNFGDAHVAVLDVDGDGTADFAVATLEQGEQSGVGTQSSIRIFESDGRGLFLKPATAIDVPLNAFPGRVVGGDFDGDGDSDDFAVAVEDVNGSLTAGDDGGALVYTNGTGTTYSLFATLTAEDAESGFTGLAAGNLGGTTADDLVVLNSQSNTFTVFLSTAGPSFDAGTSTATCTTPVAVDTGDVNPTPRDDLVVACDPVGAGDQIIVYGNNGSGTTFTQIGSPLAPATLTDPRDLVLANLDNDAQGNLDMAVTNSFLDATTPSGTVTLLEGDGLGGFIEFTASGVPVGESPVSIDAGDIDADGVLDLLTANLGDEDISVLVGSLPGGQPIYAESFFAGGFPVVEAVFADLDSAGNLDVVSTNGNESTATLSSYLGDSDDVLHAAARFNPPGGEIVGANAGAVADFDNDGVDDFAVANAVDDSVAIYRATPFGADPFEFFDRIALNAGDVPFDILADEVNGDAFVDLVVLLSPSTATGQVATFINTGNSVNPFPGNPSFFGLVGNLPWGMARGSLDNLADAIDDIAVTNLGDQSVTVLKGLASGGYGAALGGVSDVTDGSSMCDDGNEEPDCDPNGIALADIDNNGTVDMVVSRFGGADGGTLKVFTNDGNGNFSAGQTLSSDDPFSDPNDPDTVNHQTVFFSDLDGANGPDIVGVGLAPDDYISVFMNDGGGNFSAAPGSPFLLGGMDAATPDGPTNAAVTDLNMDGVPDLAVAGFFSNNIALVLGAGDGTFFPARADAYGTTQGPITVLPGDYNGDGLVDLVAVGVNDDAALLDSGLDDRGDLDGSGRTDGFDLGQLGRVFGISSSDMAYDFYFDIDADGDIDGDDLNILSQVFGLTFF